MKLWTKLTLAVTLVIAIAATCAAQAQEKGKKKKGGDGTPPAIAALKGQIEKLELKDDAKKKVEALIAEHEPKIAAAQKKVNDLLTAEQKKARAEATAKAKSDGKKGKEAADAINAAIGLTGDEKAKFDAAQAELQAAIGALRKAVGESLTDEQKAKAGLNAKAKKKA